MEGTVTFVMERKKAFAPFGKAEDVFINGVKFASLKAGASATAQVPREEVYLVEGLTIFDGSTLYPDCGDGTYHLFMETPPRSAPLFTLTYEGQPVEGKNPYEDALKAIAAPELRDEMDEPHKNLARCLIVWACTLDGFGDLLFQPDYFELPASLDAVGARSAAQALRVIHKNLFADLDLPFAGKRVSGGELFKRIDQAFSIFRDWRESEGLEKEFRDAVVRYLLSHHVY